MSAPAVAVCSACGTPRRRAGPAGQCPVCLMRLAGVGLGSDLPPPREKAGGQAWEPADFGDFIIEACLGRGPRGVVYRGVQPSIGRPVALKFFHADPARAEGLIAAADRLGAADHPALAPVFCAGTHRERPFLAMPLAAGNLRQQLAGGPPAAALVARLVAVLARAVAAAHRIGLTHSRLTPENIVFDEAGFPAITDFVCAAIPEPGGLAARPADAEFLAPEVAAGPGARPSADVFSLGAILRLCLRFVPASEDELHLGAGLQAVASHCLASEPASRPASAERLAETLELWLEQPGAPPADTAAPDATPLWG